jgi:hypothetical protein
MIVTSSAALISAMNKAENIKNAQTPDDREKALNEAYRYLDKSSYEKTNYLPLGSEFKIATNSVLSAP